LPRKREENDQVVKFEVEVESFGLGDAAHRERLRGVLTKSLTNAFGRERFVIDRGQVAKKK
jgi:hypothetical protein